MEMTQHASGEVWRPHTFPTLQHLTAVSLLFSSISVRSFLPDVSAGIDGGRFYHPDFCSPSQQVTAGKDQD